MFFLLIFVITRRIKTPKKPKANNNLECINFIKYLENEMKWNPTIGELNGTAHYYCENIEDNQISGLCKNAFLEDSQFRIIYDYLKNGSLTAFSICNAMNYSRQFGTGRLIPADLCSQVIDSLKKDFKVQNPDYVYSNEEEEPKDIREEIQRRFQEKNNPRSAHKINSYSSVRVCQNFSDDEKFSCQLVSRLAFRKTLKEIKKQESSVSICQKLEDLNQITLYRDET